MEESTAATAARTVLTQTVAHFRQVTAELGAWVLASSRTLAEIEHHTLAVVKAVGPQVLAGVCQVAAAGVPTTPTTGCACGQQAG